MSARRLLVTTALPYANGPLHIGHLVGYVQTDIFVRFQRLMGREVVYVCGDDTHGTAIMIRARQEGRTPEEVIADAKAQHERDFADFQVGFDHYGSTHSPLNRERCARIWSALRQAGLVVERDVRQLFDTREGVFLADRFVKGSCPNCKTADQYGDSCDSCGATYSPTDLIDPKSTLSGTTPEVRSAAHLFVTIESLHAFLAEYVKTEGVLHPSLANYLAGHFLSEPLRDWDVSRPAPYFGFEIPDAPGHYWYVWFDAPIGYMASTEEWCQKNGRSFDDLWRSKDTEIVHFIGKDIVYFHALFWPAMLKAAGYQLPSHINVNGHLTVNGEKMSKSKGTMVPARGYLDHLDPSYLRYFYASKLTPKPDDLDLDLKEFVAKVDSDLVNKVSNLASRTARFVDTLSAAYPDDGGLFAAAAAAGDDVAAAYEVCDTARAMRLVMELADRANQYVDKAQPWALKKDPAKTEELRGVCTVALNLFRQIALYLSPVLPRLAAQTADLFGAPFSAWSDAKQPLLGAKLAPFQHLMQRVDPKKIEAMLASSVTAEPVAVTKRSADEDGDTLAKEPLAAECTLDDFTKVDLRVARIVSAEAVPEADKLVKLQVSLGSGVTRQVFAGIKAHYTPESLVGRQVIVVANLKPRKMRFGLSEGMVVAAGGDGESFLLTPDAGAKPGTGYTEAMLASPSDLLDDWLGARLDETAREWLRSAVDGAVRGGAEAAFRIAFGSAPRRAGKAELSLDTDAIAEARRARPGWQPEAWTREQAARSLLVLALPSQDASAHRAAFEGLFEDAELGELVALYQSLPLLPYPELHAARAAEGVRTNMKPVFDAVALRNPYPAEELDDGAFNQLVVKCLFVGSTLNLVHGLDSRVNPDLVRMLSDYAHERWAAGRDVSPELWRAVGPLAEGNVLLDLERVLATGSDRERAAVVLAARHNPEAAPLLAVHAELVERASNAFPTWDDIVRASPEG